MAGGQTIGSSGSSAPPPNPVNPATGYAARPTIDPYTGYAPPPVAAPATPFRELFMSSADRNRLASERMQAAQQAQQQQIQGRQQQVQQGISHMFPGYRSARSMPQRSPFGGISSVPFYYGPPQPNYYDPYYEPQQDAPRPNFGGIASLFGRLFR